MNVQNIIMGTDVKEVARLFCSDEQAMELAHAFGAYLALSGALILTGEDGTAIIAEVLRTTYYLGYQRGKTAGKFPKFVVAGENTKESER